MSTEHLLREFYNQMYCVHTQLDNAYDLGDHLHHLTVHKHLDRILSSNSAKRTGGWTRRGPGSSPMPAVAMGALPSSWRVKPRHFQSMVIR